MSALTDAEGIVAQGRPAGSLPFGAQSPSCACSDANEGTFNEFLDALGRQEIGSCFLMSIVLVAMGLGCSHTSAVTRLTCIPQVTGAKAGYGAATIARQYLGAELTEAESGNDRAARIEAEMFEGSQGRQIIAVVRHSHYCGSGGCLTFVLALNESQRWVSIWQALSEGIAIVPGENGRCDIRLSNSRGGERLLRWQGEEYRETLP